MDYVFNLNAIMQAKICGNFMTIDLSIIFCMLCSHCFNAKHAYAGLFKMNALRQPLAL